MKSINLRVLLTVLLAIFFFMIIIGWGFERKAKVYVQALSCFTQDQKLVCFDGDMNGSQTCQQLDQDTVICSSES